VLALASVGVVAAAVVVAAGSAPESRFITRVSSRKPTTIARRARTTTCAMGFSFRAFLIALPPRRERA
jgi:hypothetical protein